MSVAYAFGYNGFRQLKNNDVAVLDRSSFVSHVDKCKNLKLSCSWDSCLLFKDDNIIIQGYCEYLKDSYLCFSPDEKPDFLSEKPKCIINFGSYYGFLTNSEKLHIFTFVRKLADSALNDVQCNAKNYNIVSLFEEQHISCVAGNSSKKILLVKDEEKIITLEKRLNSLSFHISSEITFKQKIIQLDCGKDHNLALTTDGEVFSWGIGSRGQLGHGGLTSTDYPRLVEALGGIFITKVVAGGWHSVALADTKDLYVWGWNESGQTGFPTSTTTFSSSTNIHRFSAQDEKVTVDEARRECNSESIFTSTSATSSSPACQIESGCEPVGMIPSPLLLELERYLPTNSDAFISVIDVAAGSRHTAVVISSGKVLTWGWGKYRQLGQCCCSSSMKLAKPRCGNSPHLPGLMELGDNDVAKKVVCGPWNTFVFVDHVT